jgi:hypothetical protein
LGGGLILKGTGVVTNYIQGGIRDYQQQVYRDRWGNLGFSSQGGGGGLYLFNSTFIMSGGIISSNTVFCIPDVTIGLGGGVLMGATDMKVIKTGGIIYGNTGDANGNVRKNYLTGAVLANGGGHAIFNWSNIKYKETTITGNLFYNYPAAGEQFGW